MIILLAKIARITTDGIFNPGLFQYLVVFALVIVIFVVREYANKGTNRIKDHMDDL